MLKYKQIFIYNTHYFQITSLQKVLEKYFFSRIPIKYWTI